MNASYMTYHVARGMMLYAAMLDQPACEVEGSKAQQNWNVWSAGTSEAIAAFVAGQAFDLFDRVNKAMHDGKIG